MLKTFPIMLIILGAYIFASAKGEQINGQNKILLPSKDTLLITRYPGDWYFGHIGGPQYDIYYGDFNIQEFKGIPNYNFNQHYDLGFGGGYNIGFYSEWRPSASAWGAIFSVYLPDKIKSVSYTPYINDTLHTRYRSELNLYYFTLSPEIKYRNFLWNNFFLMSGFDIMIPVNNTLYQKKVFDHTARIDYDRNIGVEDGNIRVSLNVGLGYEFKLFSLNNTASVILSPFLQFRTSSNILSDNNSTWYSSQTRAGFAIKWGLDKMAFDTLRFDPYYVEKPKTILDIAQKSSGLPEQEPMVFEALDVKKVDIDEVKAEVPKKDTLIADKVEIPQPVIKPKIITKYNKPDINFVKKSADKNIEDELYLKLDAYVDFLRKNPSAEIRIESHSDDTGTKEQNKQRAQERLDKIVNYLRKKGIPDGRILRWNRSDMNPLHAGGRKNAAENRRIEITIVQ
jgi:outer membrane protein OmpA-like peptidoglycan-associated protein